MEDPRDFFLSVRHTFAFLESMFDRFGLCLNMESRKTEAVTRVCGPEASTEISNKEGQAAIRVDGCGDLRVAKKPCPLWNAHHANVHGLP